MAESKFMKFRDRIFQKSRAASLNVIRHATIETRRFHHNNKQNPSLRHEMSMRSVSSPLSADPTDDHDDDRESHQDPIFNILIFSQQLDALSRSKVWKGLRTRLPMRSPRER